MDTGNIHAAKANLSRLLLWALGSPERLGAALRDELENLPIIPTAVDP